MQIEPITIKSIVEVIAALLMLVGLGGTIWHRVKQERGITTMSIQFLSIVFVFPTILILSLEGVLKGETSGTLIGALAGYLFAEFGRRRTPQRSEKTNEQE